MKARILIVDDDLELAELVKFRLEMSNFKVLTAEDGKKGLVSAEKERPDLILLDIMMPEIDGFEVCRRLKNDKKTKDIPIIMFTAKGETEAITRALEAGANDYIVKPYEPRVMLGKIEKLLKHR